MRAPLNVTPKAEQRCRRRRDSKDMPSPSQALSRTPK